MFAYYRSRSSDGFRITAVIAPCDLPSRTLVEFIRHYRLPWMVRRVLQPRFGPDAADGDATSSPFKILARII
jgi:hypothetical protein